MVRIIRTVKLKPATLTRFAAAAAAALAAVVISAAPARAVLFDSTGDPTFNTTAPGGALAGSGWQYEGTFGGFLATPIGPNYFLAAKHIGGSPGSPFVYSGNTFTTDAFVDSPNSDLRIWHVTGTFSSYAPLYTGTDVIGRDLVVFGLGSPRGADVIRDGSLVGWLWGSGSNLQRWGTNTVADRINLGASLGTTLHATFDHGASTNEATLSAGDSSGGVFIQDPADSVWKLAGVNYGVDGPFKTLPSDTVAFNAALFDMRGFYVEDAPNSYHLVSGASPVPAGMYATEISSNLPFILSTVPEPSSCCALVVGVFTLASLRRRRASEK